MVRSVDAHDRTQHARSGAVLDAAEKLGKLEELGRAVRSKAPEPILDAAPEAVLFVNLHARDSKTRH